MNCEENNNMEGHDATKAAGSKIAVIDYFIANAPPEYTRKQIKQAAKWLARQDIMTMETFCATPQTHLKRLRGIGYPILSLVLAMHEKYT